VQGDSVQPKQTYREEFPLPPGPNQALLDMLWEKYPSRYLVQMAMKDSGHKNWTGDLSALSLMHLLCKSFYKFGDMVLTTNDMDSFFEYLADNKTQDMKKLIEEYKFVPFPPCQNHFYFDNTEQSDTDISGFSDGETSEELAAAIYAHPELVDVWKNAGYSEICNDLNEFVMHIALEDIFQNRQFNESFAIEKLRGLTDIGFQLTDAVIADALCTFDDEVEFLGESLITFVGRFIQQDEKSISKRVFYELIKSGRTHENYYPGKLESPYPLDLISSLIEESDVQTALHQHATNGHSSSRRLSHIVCKWVFDRNSTNEQATSLCLYDILRERLRSGPPPHLWKPQPSYLDSSSCLKKTEDQITWHLFDLYKGVEFGEIHMGLVDEMPTNDPELRKWFLRKKLKQNTSR